MCKGYIWELSEEYEPLDFWRFWCIDDNEKLMKETAFVVAIFFLTKKNVMIGCFWSKAETALESGTH